MRACQKIRLVTSAATIFPLLDRHNLFFLIGQVLVDFGSVIIGELLEFLFGMFHVILGGAAVVAVLF